ncbi:MAG: DNA topoisomerase VI subunit B [Candidatus Hydrothermarchaeales archaeon]
MQQVLVPVKETVESDIVAEKSKEGVSKKRGEGRKSRLEAEREIHKHIRLQSAEELLKRVDTGFGQKTRAPFQVIVEGIQNSADAIDKAREALKASTGSDDYDARIEVVINEIDRSRGDLEITIKDTGIGIPRKKVAIIMRAGGTGTVEYKASRSQQGIGWKAAAIYANQSTGKPAEIITKTFSESMAHRHVYDYGKGKVTKLVEEDYLHDFPEHGTWMSLTLIGNYPRARSNITEFIKRMAAIHPYITFTLRENGTLINYEKRSNVGIPIPVPVPPHPNSVDVGQLKDMLAYQSKIRSIRISGFLKRNFCRIGKKSIEDLFERMVLLQYFDEKGIFAGDIIKRISQSTKVQKLKKQPRELNNYLRTLVRDVEIDYDYATQLVMKGKLNSNTNIRALNNDQLKRLFNLDGFLKEELPKPAFTPKTTVNMVLSDEKKVRLLTEVLRSMFFPAPPMDSLMPIPKEVLVEGFTTIYQPSKYTYIERKPTSTGGRPVQVQVLGMHGGKISADIKDQDRLIRIANCTPLLYEFGSDIVTQVAKDIDWQRYKLGKKNSLPNLPIIFVVHVTSPQLKYLGVAKQAIGADDVIASEVKFALQATSRKLMHHVSRLEKQEQAGRARKFLEKHAVIVSKTLSKMTGADEEEVYGMLVHEIRKRRPSMEDLFENGGE